MKAPDKKRAKAPPKRAKAPPKKTHIRGGQPGLQYAALPFRYLHSLEILLISSRETHRWVIPKGWPMKGRKPHAAAAREALEEAGVVGRIAKRPLGSYHYIKRLKNGAPLQCTVDVFPMMVSHQQRRWREQDQRTVRWFSAEEAAMAVEEPELQALIDDFAWGPARGPATDDEAEAPDLP
jgi:8-oxo-dGTP pyrophosphatase MutT (NUDIX family)